VTASARVAGPSSTGFYVTMEIAHNNPDPIRTLALDPGTRELGYAVLDRTELVYFGVHSFRDRSSARRVLADGQRFVGKLIAKFRPKLFVIEKTFYVNSKRTSLLHVLAGELTNLARDHGSSVLAYAPTTVKKAITGNGAATKRELAEILVTRRYPHLDRYLRTDTRTREQYWQNAFDAIALALTGYEEFTSSQMRAALKLPPRSKHRAA